MTIFETERLNIDEVAEAQIDEVIEIESHKENRDYLVSAQTNLISLKSLKLSHL